MTGAVCTAHLYVKLYDLKYKFRNDNASITVFMYNCTVLTYWESLDDGTEVQLTSRYLQEVCTSFGEKGMCPKANMIGVLDWLGPYV